MASTDSPRTETLKRAIRFRTSRALTTKAGDLLPLCDFVSLLIAADLSLHVYAALFDTKILHAEIGKALHRLAWIAATVAAFILYERRFAELAITDDNAIWAQGYAGRMLMCLVLIGTIAFAGHWLEMAPLGWLVAWLIVTVLLTAGSRVLLAVYLRGLMRRTRNSSDPGRLKNKVVPLQPKDQLQYRVIRNDVAYAPTHLQALARADMNPAADEATRQCDEISPALPSITERLQAEAIAAAPDSQHAQRRLQARMTDSIGDRLAVTLLADRPIKRWSAVLKSSGDVVLSSILMVLLLPLFACIALAIRLDSPVGPILFKQRRHGYNNREFHVYKFRTMRCAPEDSDGSITQTLRGDERITRIGRLLRKFSLDELPQIFNVLAGDMSLVGPRPHAVFMRTEEQLGHEITDVYLHRHRVKPGITGWSQVNGLRGATDTTEQLRRRIELDIYYIENWSLLLDLKIIFMTFKVVLRTTNAY